MNISFSSFGTLVALTYLFVLPQQLQADVQGKPLRFTATEIALPEDIPNLPIESFEYSPNGDLYIVQYEKTSYRKNDGTWLFPTDGFTAKFFNQNGILGGYTVDGAAIWDSRNQVGNLVTIPNFTIRGIANDGRVLLKYDFGADFYILEDDVQTPFNEYGFSFEVDGLFPIFMKPSGDINGVYTTDFVEIHPFTIKEEQLAIDQSISLEFLMADEYEYTSNNGHVATLAATGAALFGSTIDGIQIVDGFRAFAINDLGYAVGTINQFTNPVATIWHSDSGPLNLNHLLSSPIPVQLKVARSIQYDLSMLASGTGSDGQDRLYLLQLLPFDEEPNIQNSITLQESTVKITAVPNFEPQSISLERSVDLKTWHTAEGTVPTFNGNQCTFEMPKFDLGGYYRIKATFDN